MDNINTDLMQIIFEDGVVGIDIYDTVQWQDFTLLKLNFGFYYERDSQYLRENSL